MTTVVRRTDGSTLHLAKCLGRGAQGSVFAIAGGGHVAKIYHRPASPELDRRLDAMIRLSNPLLHNLCAWPTEKLRDEKGRVVGFLMDEFADIQEVHNLYNPGSRTTHFPHAGYPFLVQAAINCAKAVGAVHHVGVVIGDLNQRNIVIRDDARAHILDCDSFQLRYNGVLYKCHVGVPEFTSPELQGVGSLRDLVRTKDHDNFGLAVVIFYLLMLGRHPFMGPFKGPDVDLPQMIARHLYAYSAAAPSYGMGPPGNTIPVTSVGAGIVAAFEAAFRTSGGAVARPTPRQWITLLEELKGSLRICGRNRLHAFRRDLPFCPFCELGRSGLEAFPLGVGTATANGNSAPHAGPPRTFPPFPSFASVPEARALLLDLKSVRTLPATIAWGASQALQVLQWGCFILFVGSLASANDIASGVTATAAVLLFPLRKGVDHLARRIPAVVSTSSRKDLIRQLEAGLRERNRLEVEAEAEFNRAHDTYIRRQTELGNLGRKAAQARNALDSRVRELQLEAFLGRFTLTSASISGIGVQLKDRLIQRGIRNAGDINYLTVRQIDGIGKVKAQALMDWRASRERLFQFDPKRGIDPSALKQLGAKFGAERQQLSNDCHRAVQEAQAIVQKLTSYDNGFKEFLRGIGLQAKALTP